MVVATGVTAASFVALLAERGRPARLTRKEIGTLARESAARTLFWLTSPLALGLPGPRDVHEGEGPPRTPVLLVPGPPQNRLALAPLALYLRRRGIGCVWAVDAGRGTLAERAAVVARRVERLKRTSGASQVDIVAHGLGGLAAAWYLKRLDGDAHVRRLVTLGTPWRGTRMAAFTRGPLGTETLPDAPVLDDLAPAPVPTACVWGSLDPMVLPSTSAIAEGATSVKLSGAGHLDLLLSARAYRAVHAALEHPLTGTRA